MTSLIFFISRYVIIALVFYFIYRVVKVISKDLKSLATGERKAVRQVESLANSSAQPQVGVSSGKKAELVVKEGDGENFVYGQSFELRKSITLGRGLDNNIIIPDTAISKNHLKIWEEKNQWWIEDLGSKNGTFVNGVLTTKPASLVKGDQIKVGNFVFQFVRWK